MQSLHSAITPPAPPAPRQLSNFPTSRKADKLASWQVGKHRPLPLHPVSALTPPEPRIAAKRPTLYPPPPNPLRSVITLYPLRSHHSSLAPPRARRLPISATLYLISPPLLPPGRPNAAKPPTPCCARLHLYPPCICSHPPNRVARPTPHPASLLRSPFFSLTPPVNQCPPAPRSLTYTL